MQSTKKNVTQYKYRYLTIIVHVLLNYCYNYCLKIVIESRYNMLIISGKMYSSLVTNCYISNIYIFSDNLLGRNNCNVQ